MDSANVLELTMWNVVNEISCDPGTLDSFRFHCLRNGKVRARLDDMLWKQMLRHRFITT